MISEAQCSSNEDCDVIFGPDVKCGTSGFCDCAAADHVPVGDWCRHSELLCLCQSERIWHFNAHASIIRGTTKDGFSGHFF